MERFTLTTRRTPAIALLALAIGVGAVMGRGFASPGGSPAQSKALASTFSYQGYLTNTNGPVTDTCDFQFNLYDSASAGAS